MSVRTLSQQKLSSNFYAKIKPAALKGSVTFASGDYLTIANNAAFKFGSPSGNTNDYTVEFWCYPTSMSAAMAPVGVTYGTNYWAFFMNYQSGSGIDFYQTDSDFLTSGASATPINQWSHVAVSRSGTSTKLFVNGTQKASSTASINLDAANALYIGKDSNLGRPYVGRISNLRIVKGTALYTSNFTPSTTPLTAISGTTLLTCADPTTIKDSGPNALSISVASGSPTAGSQSPF